MAEVCDSSNSNEILKLYTEWSVYPVTAHVCGCQVGIIFHQPSICLRTSRLLRMCHCLLWIMFDPFS